MKCIPAAKLIAFSLCFSIGLSSCSRQIYNPALNLPAQPLKQGEVNISLNQGYMPEATPAGRQILSPAGAASVRAGLTGNLMLQAEGWVDLSPDRFWERGGYAFSALYTFGKGEGLFTYGIMPKYGFGLQSSYFNENTTEVNGHAMALSVIAYLNKENLGVKPYFGITPIYGFRSWDNPGADNGYALAFQAGLNYEFNAWLNLNAELPLVYQYNNRDEIAYLIPAPMAGISVDLFNH